MLPYINVGRVVKTAIGTEYLVSSVRGRVNFKGHKRNADGTFDPGVWSVPFAAVAESREMTDDERAARISHPRLELGTVVTFKSAPKGTDPGQKFVVIKDAGDTATVVRLGGGSMGFVFRNVSLAHVDIVPVD